MQPGSAELLVGDLARPCRPPGRRTSPRAGRARPAWAARWRAARSRTSLTRGGERVAGLLELGQVEQPRAAVRDPPGGRDPRVGRGQRVARARAPAARSGRAGRGGRRLRSSSRRDGQHDFERTPPDLAGQALSSKACRATTPRTPAGSSSGAARGPGRCTIAARRSAAAPGAAGPTACSRPSCWWSRRCCACRCGARSRSPGCGSARRSTTRPARTSSASRSRSPASSRRCSSRSRCARGWTALWRLLRRAAGHEQREGVLPRIFGATAVIALVLFAGWFLVLEGPAPSLAPR